MGRRIQVCDCPFALSRKAYDWMYSTLAMPVGFNSASEVEPAEAQTLSTSLTPSLDLHGMSYLVSILFPSVLM